MTPLWQPGADRIARTRLTAFARFAGRRLGRRLDDFSELHRLSVGDMPAFWDAFWEFAAVQGERGSRIAVDLDRMPGARFFPDARLNFAENLLRRRDDSPGDHRGRPRRRRAHDLRSAAPRRRDARGAGASARRASSLAIACAAWWPTCPRRSSPRWARPRLAASGRRARRISACRACSIASARSSRPSSSRSTATSTRGKTHDCLVKVAAIAAELPSLRRVVIVPAQGDQDLSAIHGAVRWTDWLGRATAPTRPRSRRCRSTIRSTSSIRPARRACRSASCTAPAARCIQHLKEHQLHCDIQRDDRVFYFTTCGWMMWNWLVTVLASDATIVLYDGSPIYPDAHRLFALADRAGHDAVRHVREVHRRRGQERRSCRARRIRLSALRTITSTGSPLAPESFDFVYRAIAPDVHLASISGGTDIVSCFVGGNPNGAGVARRDSGAGARHGRRRLRFDGKPLPDGRRRARLQVAVSVDARELLERSRRREISRRRISIGFRASGATATGSRRTEHGGFVIYGRSDATLNPGGVRIGTAEIYRQVEQLPGGRREPRRRPAWDGDERIVLFVRLAAGVTLDDELREHIAKRIRANTSPRHVPARIVQVRRHSRGPRAARSSSWPCAA